MHNTPILDTESNTLLVEKGTRLAVKFTEFYITAASGMRMLKIDVE